MAMQGLRIEVVVVDFILPPMRAELGTKAPQERAGWLGLSGRSLSAKSLVSRQIAGAHTLYATLDSCFRGYMRDRLCATKSQCRRPLPGLLGALRISRFFA